MRYGTNRKPRICGKHVLDVEVGQRFRMDFFRNDDQNDYGFYVAEDGRIYHEGEGLLGSIAGLCDAINDPYNVKYMDRVPAKPVKDDGDGSIEWLERVVRLLDNGEEGDVCVIEKGDADALREVLRRVRGKEDAEASDVPDDDRQLSERIEECLPDADDVILKTWPWIRKVMGLLNEALDAVKYSERASRRDDVYFDCINEYGQESQEDVAVEEMAELTKALMKGRRECREVLTGTLLDGIVDEIADVRVMMRQLEIMYDVGDMVERRIDEKAERQRKRLEASRKEEG